jgi:hypothetical protein
MLAWGFLLMCVIAGAFVLLRPDRFAFRGATLLGFLLLTLGMTSPLALHPHRMMLAAGNGTDAFIGVWDLWWARCASATGVNVLDTNWLFWPNGTSLALHTNALTYATASLPLQVMLAPGDFTSAGVAARYPEVLFLLYNLILIVSFTLAGYFTYRLALSETGHRTGALIAGVLFAFAHFRFANTVRLHVIATELLVLATWAWVALLRRPAPKALALWLGALVLLVYGSLEYAAYAVPLFVLLAVPPITGLRRGALGREARTRFVTRRTDLAWLVGGVLGAALLFFPLLRELARHASESPRQFDPRLVQFFSADLFDFFLPNPRHPLWGVVSAPITAGFHRGNGGFGLSLGWIALALLVAAAIAIFRVRQGRRWFLGFVAFALLMLGPALHVGGRVFDGVPLPQAILAKTAPFLAASRTPIRYAAPAELCLALAIATGWALRARRGVPESGASPGARPLARALPALVLGLLLFESLAAPMPLVEVPVPQVYREIESVPGASVLVHVPGIAAREDMLYQTVHRQRLADDLENALPLRGRRGTPRRPDLFARSEWTEVTRNLGTPGWVASLSESDRDARLQRLDDFLRVNGIRWVVVARQRPALSDDGRGFVTKPLMADAAYDAFLENLALLQPLRREDGGDQALFEFEAEDLSEPLRPRAVGAGPRP